MSPPSEPRPGGLGAASSVPVTVVDPGGLDPAAVARLADCFGEHVAEADGGMAFCLYRDGAPLLQLYGGVTSRGGDQVWDHSTIAVLFSGTKGIVATLAALLVDRGQLDPTASVATLWPEFSAAGKAVVRLHHVLSHTIGLPYVDPPPQGEEDLDNALMAQRLSRQQPLWEPGTKVAYHATTFGYLMTEILRRATGRSVGELLHTELAGPHGLDLHLGLPHAAEPRLATTFRADGYRVSTFLEDDPERRAIVDRMYGSTLLGEGEPFNTRAFRAAELAAGGAVGSADSMARLYSQLVGDQPLVAPETLGLFTREWSRGTDAVNDRPVRFGLGYELDDPLGTYGPPRPAFGHSGAGGGVHGAWPKHRVGFSFLANEMRSEDVDRRAKDLLALVADALDSNA